jgi:hypothetical protein
VRGFSYLVSSDINFYRKNVVVNKIITYPPLIGAARQPSSRGAARPVRRRIYFVAPSQAGP